MGNSEHGQGGPEPLSISVVIPLHNEAENIRPLHEELVAVLAEIGHPWDICYVDDGSTDGTFDRLREVADHCRNVQILRLSRRFGQSAALRAGIEATVGEVIITLDGDLQNDPRDIPRFLRKIEEGFDIVHGWRIHRQDAFLTRRLPSLLANVVIQKLLDSPTPDLGCGIRAMRRWVADHLEVLGEMHRFLPVLADELGAKSTVIQVNHRPRRAGKSKYGLRRIFAVLTDVPLLWMLHRFRWKPMRLMAALSVLSSVLGFLTWLPGVVWCISGKLALGIPLVAAGAVVWALSPLFAALGFVGELEIRTALASGRLSPYIIRDAIPHARTPSVVRFPAIPNAGSAPSQQPSILGQTGT